MSLLSPDSHEGLQSPRTLRFTSVNVRDIRNIHNIEFVPSPELNVISGDNGQGKTSILEGLTLAATTRSFRSEQIGEVLRKGASSAVVAVEIDEGVEHREHRVVLAPRQRQAYLNGKRASRLAPYATKTPIVVFHPADVELVSGSPTTRRLLLDRIALYLSPLYAEARLAYIKALKSRQQLLEQSGVRSTALDAYEALLVEHGLLYGHSHREAASLLLEHLDATFHRLAPEGLNLNARLLSTTPEDTENFARVLHEQRERDLYRGKPSIGPQRDDLEFEIDQRSARHQASQGQQRLLTLAIKLAELACIEGVRGTRPILLLDDVSSELDSDRTEAVLNFLRGNQGQVFITTTRPALLDGLTLRMGERADFQVREGCLTRHRDP